MNDYEARLFINAAKPLEENSILSFVSYPLYIYLGSVKELQTLLSSNKENITSYHLEVFYRNKLMDYFNLENSKARIEVGSIIRSGVTLSDKAIVLMGAIINTNATIGDYTMIDMNAVIGSGAIVGKNCHIGAGAVIAGVMEPYSDRAVVICDNVLIGANATILSGVTIGKNSIIGAGSVVTKDVLDNTTVAGVPAKVINTNQKWKLNTDLR